MVKSFDRGALGGASIEIEGAAIEAKAGHGLIAGHAYTLRAAIKIPDTDHRLVCLRNPWGQVEWDGKWSDNDDSWNDLEDDVKELFQNQLNEDGEFWMDIKDFVLYFSKVEICNLDVSTDSSIMTHLSILRRKN